MRPIYFQKWGATFLLFLLSLTLVQAETFFVTNINDTGAGSFRQAIIDANASTSTTRLIDATGVTGTINLASALPSLTKNMIIEGPSNNTLILRRNTGGNYRLIDIGTGLTVTINHLSITNGNLAGNGAGINNLGNLTLNYVKITACNSGTANYGGAVYNSGTLTATNCVFSSNQGQFGGAILNFQGTVSITNATFNANISSSAGGGFYNYNGTSTLTNCTFNGNTGNNGGALQNEDDSGTAAINAILTLNNCTIHNNTATITSGGGINNITNGTAPSYNRGTCYVNRSIIIGNIATAAAAAPSSGQASPDFEGEMNSTAGKNIIGSTLGTTLLGTTAGNVTGVASGTVINTTLANNGGFSNTHALIAGSPAIDIVTSGASTTDQRLYPRVGNADAGAYEFNAAPPTPVVSSVSIVATSATTVCQGTAINFNATPVNGGTAPVYEWTVANGPTIVSVGSGNPFNLATGSIAPGNYTVTTTMVSNQTPDVQNMVSTSNSISITINAGPNVTVTSSDADNYICMGDAVTFTAAAGEANYNFLVNGSSQQNGTSNVFTTSTLANGDVVTCTITSSNGCVNTSAPFTMQVRTIVTTLVSNDADNSICPGGSITFTADPSSLNPVGTTYQFFINGVSQGAASTTNTFTPGSIANNDQVSVQVTVPGLSSTTTTSFTNTNAITIPSSGNASIYPWPITVSGMTGTITNVTMNVNNYSHTWPADVDMLLSSPAGQSMIPISDCGNGTDNVNVNYLISDAGAANMISTGLNASGTYKPTNITSPDTYGAPGPGSFTAPVNAASTPMSTFNTFNPNGTWNLYVVDDAAGDLGSISSWALNITTSVSYAPCVGTSSAITVTVADTENPTITCPANITVSNTASQCNANVTVPAITATDNCGIATIVNSFTGTSNASGTYPIGTTNVTWTVTDNFGNVSTCTQTVTVNDTELPTITCPANQTLPTDAGLCTAVVTVGAPTTADNCGVASVTNSFNGTGDASGTYPAGINNVTWTVTDVNGNVNTCVTVINVTFAGTPAVTCPADISVNNDLGVCGANITVPIPTFTVACGTGVLVNDYNGTSDASDFYPIGTTVVEWSLSDASGATATCTMSITVTDNEAPVITCAALVNSNTDFTSLAIPTVSENCTLATLVNDYNGTGDASDAYPVGDTYVTWTATDIYGNSSTCVTQVHRTNFVFVPQPLYAPTEIEVVATGTNSLDFKFRDTNNNEDGYQIFRSEETENNYQMIAVIPALDGQRYVYHDTDLSIKSDTRYHYQARAYKGDKISNMSISDYDVTYPEVPVLVQALNACETTGGEIKVTGTHHSMEFRYYLTETGGEALKDELGYAYSGSDFQTEVLTGATIFYVSAYGEKYESMSRLAVNISVSPTPTAHIQGEGTLYGCDATLLLSAVEVDPSLSYQWFRNSVLIAGANSDTYEATASGWYEVRISNGNCHALSNRVFVTLQYKPLARILEGNQVRICTSGTLSAAEVEDASYAWEKDGVFLSASRIVTATTSGVYTLYVTQNGCTSSAQTNVQVSAIPSSGLVFTADKEGLCNDDEVFLTVTEVPGAVYEWFVNDRKIAQTLTPSLTTRKTGDMEVRVLLGGCSFSSEILTVERYSAPEVSFVMEADLFTLLVEGDAPYSSIRWFLNDIEQTGLADQSTIQVTQEGYYRVEVVFVNGCTSASLAKLYKILGVEEENVLVEKFFDIYPNPTSSEINLKWNYTISEVLYIQLTDDLGRILSTRQLSYEEMLNRSVQISVKSLPTGLYHIMVQGEGVSISKTFVKE